MPSSPLAFDPQLHAALPQRLPDAPGWALFLDLDGTLCPYANDPAEVALDTRQADLLDCLAQRLQGALCVLSGRAPQDLERILGGLPLRRLGSHGRDPGEALPLALEVQLDEAARVMEELAAGRAGVWVERKPAGCALHYRESPQFAESLTAALRVHADEWQGLRLLEGQCVLEAVPSRWNKGAALRQVMRDAPFAGRVPVAVGDDVTDEDAFVAAAALGGFGVAIGARHSPAARYGLADPAALHAWLRTLAFEPGAETVHA